MYNKIALLFVVLAGWASAQTTYPSDGSQSNVATLIAGASNGDTITIPAGSFTWTAGQSFSKQLTITGAGSGRCDGSSASSLLIGTGSKSFTMNKGTNGSGTVLGPTVSSPGFTPGETITANYKANGTNSMTGTVTSYDGTTLVLNITSTSGSGTLAGWTFTAPATTTIIDNSSAVLFAITESTAGSTNIGNFCIQAGTGGGGQISITAAASGFPVLIHDIWSHDTATNARTSFVASASNQGVVWNCYLDTGFTIGTGNHPGYGFVIDANALTTSWTSASTMGSADTTGRNNFYIENVYFAGCLTESHDFSNNSRAVLRYAIYDNSGGTTHGADTGNYGQRHFEVYNSLFIPTEMGASSPALAYWIFIRGGTGILFDNVMPNCSNSQYPNKPSVSLTAENLQRDGGPNPLWAWGSASVAYPVPRQVGFGRVTGSGTTSWTLGPGISVAKPAGYTVSGSTDSITYVGDSEPFYQWNNTGTGTYATPTISDYAAPNGAGNAVAGYIQVSRDYINGAKSGYTPYTYPHPLRGGSGGVAGAAISGGASLIGGVSIR